MHIQPVVMFIVVVSYSSDKEIKMFPAVFNLNSLTGSNGFSVNAASITPTPIPSPSPIPTPTPENHELSSGAIAGIVISGVVTILGGFLCYAKHRGWITEPAPVPTYHPMPASAPVRVPEPRVNMPLSDFLDLLRRAAGR